MAEPPTIEPPRKKSSCVRSVQVGIIEEGGSVLSPQEAYFVEHNNNNNNMHTSNTNQNNMNNNSNQTHAVSPSAQTQYGESQQHTYRTPQNVIDDNSQVCKNIYINIYIFLYARSLCTMCCQLIYTYTEYCNRDRHMKFIGHR